MKDYHILPKLKDSISYIYIEYAIIEKENSSIIILRSNEKIAIPIAVTTCLMLGPGTNITHDAVKVICEAGCMIVWCGDQMQRYYACGMGETRSAKNTLKQAMLCMNPDLHLEVAKRMYEIRFEKLPQKEYTIQQLRGMEGIRMREAYKVASKLTGVEWKTRKYEKDSWDESDPINRALSQANAILYAVCQAAIISLGFSTALGFVHTGKMLSFVYDIADIYKTKTTIPAAFAAAKYTGKDMERQVRLECRKRFESYQILKRIPADIAWIFDVKIEEQQEALTIGDLWDSDGSLQGGKNYGGIEDGGDGN